MTAHERVNRRALAVLLIPLLLLLFCAPLAYWYWWRTGDGAATDRAAQSRRDEAHVADDPALAIKQIVGEINAARADAENARDGAEGYAKENCGAVNRLEQQGHQLTASERIAAANQCANYTQKFNLYHNRLEGLLASAAQIETIDKQVEELVKLKPNPSPIAVPSSPSWLALLLVAVVSVAVSVAASAALYISFADRKLHDSRQPAAVLAQGFSTMNESLQRVHATLSDWARSSLPNAGVEKPSGCAGKSVRGGSAERATEAPHPLAAEVRQGFKELQGVLLTISDKLSAPVARPDRLPLVSHRERPAASDGQAGVSSAPSSSSPSAEPSSLSLTSRPPSSLSLPQHSSPPALEPHPPTPAAMPVENYKQRFEAAASVTAAYKTGYLETNDDGKLLVLRDECTNQHYLIPKEERLQTPSFFNLNYATYYEGDVDLKPGLILILRPATVSPAGALWQLETRGRLTTGKQS